ncbi:MAG: MerR family transcriptional regulator [Thermodesulfovibrionales bacterium]|nr:MerR family transcriptional regulator [Thermodesulfovibrionales bacterium]
MNKVSKKSQSLSLFPDKIFYRIGEVSKILEVEPYILRYWESEFLFIRPQRTKRGQRIYTKQDIDLLKEIKRLLYEEKYTINGVKKKISKNNIKSETIKINDSGAQDFALSYKDTSTELIEVLSYVKKKLREILTYL